MADRITGPPLAQFPLAVGSTAFCERTRKHIVTLPISAGLYTYGDVFWQLPHRCHLRAHQHSRDSELLPNGTHRLALHRPNVPIGYLNRVQEVNRYVYGQFSQAKRTIWLPHRTLGSQSVRFVSREQVARCHQRLAYPSISAIGIMLNKHKLH